jgi:hypothetical protein
MGIFSWLKDDPQKKKPAVLEAEEEVNKTVNEDKKQKPKPGEKQHEPNKKGALHPVQWQADASKFLVQLTLATSNFTRPLDREQFDKMVRSYRALPLAQQMAVSNTLYRQGQATLHQAIATNSFELIPQSGVAQAPKPTDGGGEPKGG